MRLCERNCIGGGGWVGVGAYLTHLTCTHMQASPLRANFGVAGAVDDNNELVMTQSLVHRTHQHIFGRHFPQVVLCVFAGMVVGVSVRVRV